MIYFIYFLHRLWGRKNNDSCVCAVNSSMWSFPVVKYEAVHQQVLSCEGSLNNLQEQVGTKVNQHHFTLWSLIQTRNITENICTYVLCLYAMLYVDRMTTSDTINMKTVKDKLRYLKNSAEYCKSIPKDFKGKCLMTNISDPVMTKVSPYGKSYISGSWGKQAQMDSLAQMSSYWVLPLLSGHIWGNSLRMYQTYEDFMASVNNKDYTFAPSYTHADAIEGPSAVLYGEALYYHCYRSADVCRYDLNTNIVKRVTLPGIGVGFNNKFPYCYYECRANSDVDIEADETGLWAIYATVGNHGNLVVSRLVWDSEGEELNVTQTWATRLFKKAATNAFMVCGVLYATRYVDEYREEVFYAFDTATGKEDNSLALPLEKVAKGVASLSYNPTNRQIFMYNDGYLLAYQAHF
uniref:Si:ch211-194m7.8 n=1 Tax=Seriola lalandi dorsalis TaxID=1841481 RepID=A0A3B4WKT8_SERLL